MKKILSLALLLIFCCAQFCLAAQTDDEDIDQYFVDEPEQTQPVDETQKAVSDPLNLQPAQPSTQADENSEPTADSDVQLDSTASMELNGYLQFNQPSEDEIEDSSIHLEPVETKSVNFSKPKAVNSNDMFADFKKPTFSPIQDKQALDAAASRFSTQEYQINPVSTSYTKKIGKFSFGTMYDSYMDSAQINYSTGIFSRYDSKHFAISTSFSKSTDSNYASYDDKIYFIPEWKITKRLSLLDVMQSDVDQINKKNEVVLRYTPHLKNHTDDVQLEVGAGQSFYDDNYVKSSLRFSTRFKL